MARDYTGTNRRILSSTQVPWLGRTVNSRRLSVLLLLALALAGCGGSSSSPPNNSATMPPPTLPPSTHVFLLVLDTHTFSPLIRDPPSPSFHSLAAPPRFTS